MWDRAHKPGSIKHSKLHYWEGKEKKRKKVESAVWKQSHV